MKNRIATVVPTVERLDLVRQLLHSYVETWRQHVAPTASVDPAMLIEATSVNDAFGAEATAVTDTFFPSVPQCPPIVFYISGNDDATEGWLRNQAEQGLPITILRSENNAIVPYAQAVNAAAKTVEADWLFVLNNDVILQPGFWAALDEMIGAGYEIIGSKLLYPNGTIQHYGKVFSLDFFPFHILRYQPADHPQAQQVRPFPDVTFACTVIKKDIWDDLGGLDEQYLNGFEDDDFCALQDTSIITDMGALPIQSVGMGQSVLSADATYNKVIETYQRPYSGPIFGIKPMYRERIWLTGNHPVMTMNGWKRADAISDSDWVWIPGLPYEPELTGPIYIRRWLGIPDSKSSGRKKHKIVFAGQHKNAESANIPSAVPVTWDFARLMGYYLAEGSTSKANSSALAFSFAAKERQYIDDVKSLMLKCFGIRGREDISATGRGMRISYSSKALALFFSNLLGKGAKHKHLPAFAARLSKSQRIELLKAYWYGDGHENPSIGMTTSSPDLARQLGALAASCGLLFGVRRASVGKFSTYRLDLTYWHDNDFRRLCGLPTKQEPPNRGRYHHRCFKPGTNGFWAKVAEVETRLTTTTVYNLAVESTNSYVAGGIAVHNCLAARERGAQIGVHPGMLATHLEAQTSGQDTGNKAAMWQKFHAKWIATDRIIWPLGVFPQWRQV